MDLTNVDFEVVKDKRYKDMYNDVIKECIKRGLNASEIVRVLEKNGMHLARQTVYNKYNQLKREV